MTCSSLHGSISQLTSSLTEAKGLATKAIPETCWNSDSPLKPGAAPLRALFHQERGYEIRGGLLINSGFIGEVTSRHVCSEWQYINLENK